MNYRFLLLIPIFLISACSSSDEAAPTSSTETTEAAAKAEPKKISPNNPFATQINALDTAKLVGNAAQQSVDSSQQKLEDAAH